QVYAEVGDVAACLAEHVTGDGRTLGGDDLLESALGDDALDAILHDLGKALAGQILASAGRLEIARRVLDTPLHVEIDDQAAVVVGKESLAGVGQGQDAAVELHHLVPGPLRVQSRRVV